MFLFKSKRWIYHSIFLVMTGMMLAVVISGLNLTAKRMSAIVPQLPEYAVSVEKSADSIYFDLLGHRFQVGLPGFLKGAEDSPNAE